MKRLVFAILLFLAALAPTKADDAFICVPTGVLLQELAQVQPPLEMVRLDPHLIPGFISGMSELANIPPPLPMNEVTGVIVVSASYHNLLVVLYEVEQNVCAAVKMDKRMAIDILRKGAEI